MSVVVEVMLHIYLSVIRKWTVGPLETKGPRSPYQQNGENTEDVLEEENEIVIKKKYFF